MGEQQPALWFGGGEAGCRHGTGKNANMDVCVFFYLTAPDHGEGAAPPPFEALMHGFVNGTTGATTEGRECREQTHPFCILGVGSPPAREGVNRCHRPEYIEVRIARLLLALGGLITLSPLGCFYKRVNVTLCEGWGAGVFALLLYYSPLGYAGKK